MTTIAIVTPWLEHRELARDYFACVAGLRVNDQLIIVDNGSSPLLEFATLRRSKNLGFCGGSNLGMRAATADAILFLNNDVHQAEEGWLEDLREAVEPGVLAGPIVHASHAVVDDEPYPYIAGWCCIGMRDDLLKLGGWDSTLDEPGYYSDNLLSFEARLAGMTLRNVKARIRHKEGTTARDAPSMSRVAARNRERYIQRVRGALAATT